MRLLENEYRVTKYDPAFRDERGRYTKDDWILFTQVGQTFAGKVLTLEAYESVEDAYAEVALAFLSEGGVSTVTIRGLWESNKRRRDLREGQNLALESLKPVIRRLLRDEIRCRLESQDGFLHFDWDFYMYIGVTQRCPAAEALASKLGLYVEECESPVGHSVREYEAESQSGN